MKESVLCELCVCLRLGWFLLSPIHCERSKENRRGSSKQKTNQKQQQEKQNIQQEHEFFFLLTTHRKIISNSQDNDYIDKIVNKTSLWKDFDDCPSKSHK